MGRRRWKLGSSRAVSAGFLHGGQGQPHAKKLSDFCSEGGAEVDNVGLQFLTIPAGAATIMPIGTKYADYANTHNYVTDVWHVYQDNQARNAADFWSELGNG